MGDEQPQDPRTDAGSVAELMTVTLYGKEFEVRVIRMPCAVQRLNARVTEKRVGGRTIQANVTSEPWP
jgi:hypothetical protein